MGFKAELLSKWVSRQNDILFVDYARRRLGGVSMGPCGGSPTNRVRKAILEKNSVSVKTLSKSFFFKLFSKQKEFLKIFGT